MRSELQTHPIERLQLRHNNDVIRARELRGVQPCGTWGSTTALLCEIHSLAWRKGIAPSYFQQLLPEAKKRFKKRFKE